MKSFCDFILESIVDPVRETLSKQIFDLSTNPPKLLDKSVGLIKEGIAKIDSKNKVLDYKLIGSVLTRRYRDDADLDVTVLVDGKESDLEQIRPLLRDLNGVLVPDTEHPVNYHVRINKDEYNQALEDADAVFDVEQNKFIRQESEKPFDVKKYWSEFSKVASEIDDKKMELKRDVIDYTELSKYSPGEIKFLKQKVEEKISEIEELINSLIDTHCELKNIRRDAFARKMTPDEIKEFGHKNRLPVNVIYKLLEKYRYFEFIEKLDDVIGDDRELSPDEAKKLKALLSL